MTLRLKIELIIGAVLLLGALLGAKVWLDEHDSRIKAEASVAAQQQLQQQYQAQVSDLAKRLEERDANYREQTKSLEAKFQSAATAEQMAQLISGMMGLRQPLSVSNTPPQASGDTSSKIIQLPEVDLPQVKAYAQDCETCKLNLAKATADAADRESQAHLAQLQIDSLKKENLSLTQAVKGGTFFQRLGKATKYLVLGGAGAIVAVCGTGHCK
jgi:hypothetical protein